MQRLVTFLVILLISSNLAFSQQQYEGFSSKKTSYSFGYLAPNITTPEMRVNNNLVAKSMEFKMDGIMFNYSNRLGSLGTAIIGANDQMDFYFDSNTRLGFGYGETEFKSNISEIDNFTAKYYCGILDVYSFDFGIEYDHIFNDGSALVIKFAYNFANLGATFATPDGGKIEDDGILMANIFPLIFKPSIHYSFGKQSIGLTFILDAGNILGFGYTKEGIFNNDYRGLTSKTLFGKFAILFTYGV